MTNTEHNTETVEIASASTGMVTTNIDHHHPLYLHPSDAPDDNYIWEDLKERFDKVNSSRAFQLHKDIFTLWQGVLSDLMYYSRLKDLWDEYDSIVPPPACCPKSKEFIDHLQYQRMLQFFMGLNDRHLRVYCLKLMKCDFCHRTGHLQIYCYKLIGYPDNFKGKVKKANAITGGNFHLDGTCSYQQEKMQHHQQDMQQMQ
ncbi:uncharacterized protein LOC132613316 [Lycium barbarum]|uniref:uncharacterized protein LOC132613316 n=1 Tax=Lycium barbarum TaxID=112863 RepID=UPI00293EB845|nr:uncharacterized protein LOC132613316 [Lycium barbarum]